MDNFNQRQIEIMKKKTDDFLESKISLGDLINDLRAILVVLENVNQEWRKKVYNEWFTLEQFYAAELDEQEGGIKYREEINSSIKKLKKFIDEYIKC